MTKLVPRVRYSNNSLQSYRFTDPPFPNKVVFVQRCTNLDHTQVNPPDMGVESKLKNSHKTHVECVCSWKEDRSLMKIRKKQQITGELETQGVAMFQRAPADQQMSSNKLIPYDAHNKLIPYDAHFLHTCYDGQSLRTRKATKRCEQQSASDFIWQRVLQNKRLRTWLFKQPLKVVSKRYQK